jgi:hypothetical protein
MKNKTMAGLALVAGCVLGWGAMPAHAQPSPAYPPVQAGAPQLETNGPQASRGDYGDWSAREDVVLSRRYDRLLETSLAFRRVRERRECGPITLPDLRAQCLASFRQYEPVMVGSSAIPRRHRTYRGAGY